VFLLYVMHNILLKMCKNLAGRAGSEAGTGTAGIRGCLGATQPARKTPTTMSYPHKMCALPTRAGNCMEQGIKL